jgi:site-specific recombinase XerC
LSTFTEEIKHSAALPSDSLWTIDCDQNTAQGRGANTGIRQLGFGRQQTLKTNRNTQCARATAATNALDHQADIAKVQEWLGHAYISTTRIYDHRKTRPEESPTFKVNY